MKRIWITILSLSAAANVGAQIITLEPDNYAGGTVLNHIFPEVSLVTAASNNVAIPFNVVATTSTYPWQPPTGNNVFAHAGGIPFFYTDRKLRMDFNGLVSYVGIIFQGGNNLVTERGELDVFGIGGILLHSYQTQPLLGGQTELMSITEPVADIAWATAFTVAGDDPFGRLDALSFSTPVPEPALWTLFGIGGAILFWARRCAAKRG